MKLIALIVVAAFLSGCSGFNKPIAWPAEHESELLYWCKVERGIWPVYLNRAQIEASDCEEVNYSRAQWDHTELTVVTFDEALLPELLEAIDYFNAELGFTMFVYSPGNLDADIEVAIYGDHPFAAAEAKLYTYEGRMRGAVLAYNGLEDRNRADIMVHELGHLLGLRHDASTKSIMYAGGASRVAQLEAEDLEVIRRLYQ